MRQFQVQGSLPLSAVFANICAAVAVRPATHQRKCSEQELERSEAAREHSSRTVTHRTVNICYPFQCAGAFRLVRWTSRLPSHCPTMWLRLKHSHCERRQPPPRCQPPNREHRHSEVKRLLDSLVQRSLLPWPAFGLSWQQRTAKLRQRARNPNHRKVPSAEGRVAKRGVQVWRMPLRNAPLGWRQCSVEQLLSQATQAHFTLLQTEQCTWCRPTCPATASAWARWMTLC